MQLLGAEVMAVSTVAVQGRAVVTVVSRWPVSAVAEVLLVSKSARCCVLCAKKFALQAQNGRKTLFSGVPGEFFADKPLEAPRWANFFAGSPRGSAAGRILSRNRADVSRAGRTLSRHWRRWHALRLPVNPARRADHSQAEADRALLPQINRPPTHHAGAGGTTKNAWDSSSNEQCTRCTRR